DFERSGIGSAAGMRRSLEELIAFCKENRSIGQPAMNHRPELRAKIADRFIEMAAGRNLSYRIASIQEAGRVPNYEASMAKVFFSELNVRLGYTGFQVLQVYGQVRGSARRSRGASPRRAGGSTHSTRTSAPPKPPRPRSRRQAAMPRGARSTSPTPA